MGSLVNPSYDLTRSLAYEFLVGGPTANGAPLITEIE